MADFQYEPLLKSDSIRLLLLEPSLDPSSDIHCHLLHTSLADCNDEIIDQCTALSYVWGDPNSQKKISVNGQTVHITLNLFHALRDLRDAQRVHRLWVDAICINQFDLQERNQQVGLMGSIYSMAQHTVIYLGERSVDSDAVLKVLRGPPEESDASPGLLALVEREILTRPWFTRVWIFQELVLSRDPRIQLGTSRLRWDDFCNCLERLLENRAPTGNPPVLSMDALIHDIQEGQAVTLSMVSNPQTTHSNSSVQQSSGHYYVPVDVPVQQRSYFKVLQDMQATRKRFQIKQLNPRERAYTFLDILLARRGFGVTDARDMIFGHLGIAADSAKDLGISVDYDISAVQGFINLAKSIMVQSEDLEILFYVQDMDPSLRRIGLPSWVPDWTSTEFHDFHFASLWTRNLGLIGHEEKRIMPISKEHPLSNEHPLFKIWDEEPGLLAIGGWNLGSIVATSPVIQKKSSGTSSPTSPWSPNLLDLAVFYPNIYNAWRRQSGFGLLPPFDVYQGVVENEFELVHHLFDITKEANWGWYDTYSLASLLVLHTFSDLMATGSLSGRRIATLSNGRMAIVPGSSLPGDLVCRFERFLDPWVLRDKDDVSSHSTLDCQVVHRFDGCEYGKSYHWLMKEAAKAPLPDKTLTHAVFIGESFVDYNIGRSMNDEGELGTPSIFIIR